ncbi:MULTISPECIES: M10 family metallopeptidase [Deefgea]|uniref:Peptidase metallopeptidase domain-containing protein n=1 Tax=Deefgea chitinilytica TaxID=570276 RepID=A0ABS2C9T2_9NEIS|nr:MULTISPECIES: M10 family metallopeptidase [Deefgea]MBM5570901.1 hypothetical protein [Deefgea chitinilytica]MBM9888130.1 M10 family metallopeptidase C-terminal domain-containing protein [Deefgea sp. CFH1-16]
MSSYYGVDISLSAVSNFFPTQNTSTPWLMGGTKWGAGAVGTPHTLTYSFVSSWLAVNYGDPFNDVGWSFSANQQQAARSALGAWSAVSGLKFNEVNDSFYSAGDIRWGNSWSAVENPTAYAYYPSSSAKGGDIWLGPAYPSFKNPVVGTYAYATYLHELGHALGLKHPHEGANLADDLHDQLKYSVMSYRAYEGDVSNEYSTEYYPTTPMLDDIRAIQFLYGKNITHRAGSDVYSWAGTSKVFETIWDTNGIDVIDASSQLKAVLINLNPGTFSQIGVKFYNGKEYVNDCLAIADDCIIENAIGSNYDDQLLGNSVGNSLSGGAGVDTLIGGLGNDTLNGGAGIDSLVGGLGDDAYVIDSVSDIIVELSNEGVDEVRASAALSFASYTLQTNFENLTVLGTAAFEAIGNEYANKIVGNSGANKLIGNAGVDTLIGGLGNDTLIGDNGDADLLDGGAGNDVYQLNSVNNIVNETIVGSTGGFDEVQVAFDYTLGSNLEKLKLLGSAIMGSGNLLNNELNGNDSNNSLNGAAGDDSLNGGSGNDTLDGGVGIDSMSGGIGDDVYLVDNVGDKVVELAEQGLDRVQASITYALTANVEQLTLLGALAINGTGNALNNTLVGNSAANILDGGLGIDTLQGGAGNDVYLVDQSGDVVQEDATDGAGIDEVRATASLSFMNYTLSNNVENLTILGTTVFHGTGNGLANKLIGNAAANRLDGLAGVDTLVGGLGNDTLLGSAGDADLLDGGAGNDRYELASAHNVVNESIVGAAGGVDVVIAGFDYALGNNLENLSLIGTAIQGTGNGLDNQLTGNANNNLLSGGAGNDTLVGDLGNDTLDGGVGIDSMSGGAGDDVYIVDNAGDKVVEIANEGIDVVQSAISYGLTANVEKLTLLGALAINGTGNLLDNTLVGNSAANILDGGLGIDTLQGGNGNDIYLVDHSSDVVVEDSIVGAGIDEVRATASVSFTSYSLSSNVENLTVLGVTAFQGFGNSLANKIVGNAAANLLDGLAGVDTLLGGSGNDTLVGSLGDADLLDGGAGDDRYILASIENIVNESITGALGGIDEIVVSFDYELGNNIENLILEGNAIQGIGNILNNVITGNSENNVLDGQAGNDSLVGAAGNDVLSGGLGNDTLDGGTGLDVLIGDVGNDVYVVDSLGDIILEVNSLAGGIDEVRSTINYTIKSGLENLTLLGSAISGTGNAVNNILRGNDVSNLLSGAAGDDTLNGGAGDDTLDGGQGVDSMSGGIGDDVYLVDNVGDKVVELAEQGLDRVQASITYALTANVENLTLNGMAAINGTGNALNNTLVGNSAANILDGGLGVDTLQGGAGNDVYLVDHSGDVVQEDSTDGAGLDEVRATASLTFMNYTLSNNVENLTILGTTVFHGTGNGLANKLIGNAAANRLDGLAGADTLVGGLGNDTLIGSAGDADLLDGGAGNDRYELASAHNVVNESIVGAAGGIDEVVAGFDYVLGNNLENLSLNGTAIQGTGNGLDNQLTGNANNNLLSGGAGNDTLVSDLGNDTLDGGVGIDSMSGGAGDDVYIVDNVGDKVIELLDQGVDLVQSNFSFSLLNCGQVENLTLTGVGAINATGNLLANNLVGNSANNFIDGGLGNDSLYGYAGNDTLVGGAGSDQLYGGVGADQFRFTLKEAAVDQVMDFSRLDGDKLAFSMAGFKTGNADLVVNLPTVASASGFSKAAELIVFTSALSSDASTTDVANLLGYASANYSLGEQRLFVLNNSHDSLIYNFNAANADSQITANELTLIGSVHGVSNLGANDFVFIA